MPRTAEVATFCDPTRRPDPGGSARSRKGSKILKVPSHAPKKALQYARARAARWARSMGRDDLVSARGLGRQVTPCGVDDHKLRALPPCPTNRMRPLAELGRDDRGACDRAEFAPLDTALLITLEVRVDDQTAESGLRCQGRKMDADQRFAGTALGGRHQEDEGVLSVGKPVLTGRRSLVLQLGSAATSPNRAKAVEPAAPVLGYLSSYTTQKSVPRRL